MLKRYRFPPSHTVEIALWIDKFKKYPDEMLGNKHSKMSHDEAADANKVSPSCILLREDTWTSAWFWKEGSFPWWPQAMSREIMQPRLRAAFAGPSNGGSPASTSCILNSLPQKQKSPQSVILGVRFALSSSLKKEWSRPLEWVDQTPAFFTLRLLQLYCAPLLTQGFGYRSEMKPVACPRNPKWSSWP